MLAVQLKPEDEVLPRIFRKRLFIFECLGCQEVYFPRQEVEKFIESLENEITAKVAIDYLCNRDFVREYVKAYSSQIKQAELILVFSCGVGAQVLCSLLEDRIVYTGCNTLYLNGFQGLSVQNFDCRQCGQCYLNLTGGICPLANCSKGLLNGPCGGAKDGKCEANPEADCAWELIYKRLKRLGKLDLLRKSLSVRDYSLIMKSET